MDELLTLFCELNPDLSGEFEFAIDKWVATRKFAGELDELVGDLAAYLRTEFPDDYPMTYDPNPFDVEPQLVGTSGEWYYTDAVINQSLRDACDEFIEACENKKYNVDIYDWLGGKDINENTPFWEFLIDKIAAKLKQLKEVYK